MDDDAATQEQPAVSRPLELVPERVLGRDQQHYAIVDIGSNSVRLVVYDQLGRAPFPRFNEKSLCRLAEGLDETGELPAEGARRTVEAVRRFKAVATAMDAGRIDVLATEAVRRASNGPALAAEIAKETGLAVRVLSGGEEAHYAGLGVVSGFYRPTGLVGDMGGGSLEVVEVIDDRVGERSVSLPLGALPVQSLLARHGVKAKDHVDELLKARLPPNLTGAVFHAVGGGWRALAKVHMANVGCTGAGCARLHAEGGQGAQVHPQAVADAGGRGGEGAGRAVAPGADDQGGGPGPGPGAEAAGAGPAGVLGPGRARGLALHPARCQRSAISTR